MTTQRQAISAMRVKMDIETRAREVGYKIKDEQGIWIFEQGIAYIEQALQAVRDEAIEESCKVICTRCKERTPVDNQGYHDLGNGVTVACSARNIRLLKERKEP